MQPYPLWKVITLILVTALGFLYALPNFYGKAPAVEIVTRRGDAPPADFDTRVTATLKAAGVAAESQTQSGAVQALRFANESAQRKAADALKKDLGVDYIVALAEVSKSPAWLTRLGARPLNLGLDLRGGVHFLLEVDINDALKSGMARNLSDIPAYLRKEGIRYGARRIEGDSLVMEFASTELRDKAVKALAKEHPELTALADPALPQVRLTMSEAEVKRVTEFALEQNLTTLRNRVNQLGVSEPLVQRQGANRIVVQLPAVQDTTRVKEILGATATLEYRAVDETSNPEEAAGTGIIPPGTELYYTRDGRRPVLLSREIIAGGSNLVSAAPNLDENGQPMVEVRLDSQGGKRMLAFTEKSVGKPMAVLFKESVVETTFDATGKPERKRRDVQEVISIATIQGVFGNQFRTTGLEQLEAQKLAQLLKAGALAAPVVIVEERTIGPSLGAENVKKGVAASVLGLALVSVFMVVYYRVFGLFAIAALSLNLLLLVAILSVMGAALTVPGIAGIVLHMGIAVDANVLIYERIREELSAGMKPHDAIQAGYDRAFLTIADANVTVLIGTAMLFALGAGPVKGFAITLFIGILTSQFTAIVGTRALAQWAFARKARMQDLPIW